MHTYYQLTATRNVRLSNLNRKINKDKKVKEKKEYVYVVEVKKGNKWNFVNREFTYKDAVQRKKDYYPDGEILRIRKVEWK